MTRSSASTGSAACRRSPSCFPRRSRRPICPGLVKTLIAAIPDGTIDSALPTGPVLRRAVDELDVARLVRELDDPDRLQSAVRSAILRAARDEILGRLRPG